MLPETTALATAYNDTVAPYLKFGVYKVDDPGIGFRENNTDARVLSGRLEGGRETTGGKVVRCVTL